MVVYESASVAPEIALGRTNIIQTLQLLTKFDKRKRCQTKKARLKAGLFVIGGKCAHGQKRIINYVIQINPGGTQCGLAIPPPFDAINQEPIVLDVHSQYPAYSPFSLWGLF